MSTLVSRPYINFHVAILRCRVGLYLENTWSLCDLIALTLQNLLPTEEQGISLLLRSDLNSNLFFRHINRLTLFYYDLITKDDTVDSHEKKMLVMKLLGSNVSHSFFKFFCFLESHKLVAIPISYQKSRCRCSQVNYVPPLSLFIL